MIGRADPALIQAAIDILTPPEAWTQKTYARHADGYPCGQPHDPLATCWCLSGALTKAECRTEERRLVVAEIRRLSGDKIADIPAFNDAKIRKHAHVLALLQNVKRTAERASA